MSRFMESQHSGLFWTGFGPLEKPRRGGWLRLTDALRMPLRVVSWTIRAFAMRTGRGRSLYTTVGKPSSYEYAEYLRRNAGLRIGRDTTVNCGASFTDDGMVTIGDNCSVSVASFITHSMYDRIATEILHRNIDTRRPITIGHRCFIGYGAIILAGSTIGDDCLIGAGAVVRGHVPADSLVIGNPGQVVKKTSEYLQQLDRQSRR